VIKTTRLSQEFDYDDFLAKYGPSTTIPLFIVTESGRLRPCVTREKVAPKAGQSIIALTEPLTANDSPPAQSPE
jgi:hypothetical protein